MRSRAIYIPAEIWQLKELSLAERVLLSEIAYLHQQELGCIAGNDYFAQLLGVSKESVKKYLIKLKRLELVEIVKESSVRKLLPGRVKSYPEVGKILPDAEVKSYPGMGKILPHTNIEYSYRDKNIDIEEEDSVITYPFDTKEFKDIWQIWLDERKQQRIKKYTARGEQAALHNLQKISNDDEETAIQIIKQSIAQGWRGLFPLKQQRAAASTPKYDSDELRAYIEA